jgi:hypothetical protein
MDPAEFRQERVTTVATEPVAEPAAPAGAAVPAETPATRAVAPAAVAPVASATTTRTTTSTAAYSGAGRISAVVWLIVGVVDAILALDFIFRAAGGANTGFAHYVYRLGGWLAAPFDGIFQTTALVNGNTFIRWADVLAVAIYSLAALAVATLIRIMARPPRV